MDEDRICGLNAVRALFARRPESVKRLLLAESTRAAAEPMRAQMAERRKPYRVLDADELARAAGTQHHGGIVAVAVSRPVVLLDFERPPRHPFLLVLDGVGNPHNLGAIARSAAFFGVRALLLHETPAQAMPSDAAYRVAEGGLEHLELYRTRSLRKALQVLDPYYRTVAATLTAEAARPEEVPHDRALALVLGNEEHGVSQEALETCRRQVRVRGSGTVQSLNVAQSAAVLLHALTVRR